ncbi:MAG TPA: aldose 1-epimerase [Bryobacteraceae bacterium]|nr:aldose 1-epimerase [Bryobacteraceae bacterium]
MTIWKPSAAVLAALLCSLPMTAQYSAKQEGDVVHLEDAKHHTVVSILTSVGNVAYEMKVNGTNVLYFPAVTPEAYKQRPGLAGIPFLAPWANRLDEPAFYANGKKYVFNEGLGNVRGAIPIHGFLSSTDQWKVVEAKADKNQAWVTSRLEFYRHPDWMAQFPFAHTIEMTYRLKDGVLEVHTKIENLSTDPMPIAIGFHPYYHLTDAPREEWNFSIAARTHWILAPNKIPTGETRPIETFFPDPKSVPLKDYSLDHVFGDLIRDAKGGAAISMWDKKQRIDLTFGPKFQAAVLYSPSPTPSAIPPERGGPDPNAAAGRGRGPAGFSGGGRGAFGGSGRGGGRGAGRGGPPPDPNFLAIEPMAGITDAMNLAQKGLYKEQQMLAPGATWEESFWVKPSGF